MKTLICFVVILAIIVAIGVDVDKRHRLQLNDQKKQIEELQKKVEILEKIQNLFREATMVRLEAQVQVRKYELMEVMNRE
jgi:TolA-binding protein